MLFCRHRLGRGFFGLVLQEAKTKSPRLDIDLANVSQEESGFDPTGREVPFRSSQIHRPTGIEPEYAWS